MDAERFAAAVEALRARLQAAARAALIDGLRREAEALEREAEAVANEYRSLVEPLQRLAAAARREERLSGEVAAFHSKLRLIERERNIPHTELPPPPRFPVNHYAPGAASPLCDALHVVLPAPGLPLGYRPGDGSERVIL